MLKKKTLWFKLWNISNYWRHKILNCISEFLGIGSVDGVVEADEVFFAYSYKGTKPANMPRPSRKGGKEVCCLKRQKLPLLQAGECSRDGCQDSMVWLQNTLKTI